VFRVTVAAAALGQAAGSMRYFAFITRDAEKRYRAELPDFPGGIVWADSLAQLPQATADMVERYLGGLQLWRLPAPTATPNLPLMSDALDGFWLLVELPSVPAGESADAPHPLR
jgi:predicted RNase H-like HicB family nuclease